MKSAKPKNPKIPLVFFGTGPISVQTIQGLSQSFDIEAIITKTDRKSSGGKLLPTLLADWGTEHGLPTYKVANKAELNELFVTQKFQSKLGVVVDFGIIISKQVIDSFPHGILNSHFSLLPRYRGADPITAAILHGDTKTGVSIMIIEPTLDTGKLLGQETFAMPPDIGIAELETQLTNLGAKMLIEIIPPYLESIIEPSLQSTEGVTHTTTLTKQDGLLDPTKTATQLANQVRAFATWPKSYLDARSQRFIVTGAKPSDTKVEQGKLTTVDNKLLFGCHGGSLEITQIQPAGKKPMDATSFINGYKQLLT